VVTSACVEAMNEFSHVVYQYHVGEHEDLGTVLREWSIVSLLDLRTGFLALSHASSCMF
jgi:hypothetical protein